MLLILAALFSCGGKRVAERSDLVRADSLMWICPDSSLAILREVNPAELDEANRAYYALLMTQALVRKEQSPTSDSLISIAFDYYRDNHNRERLTRTLIYMGACCDLVAETPDYMKALRYYLAAEKNADTADYVNLAQINMRIGYLYNSKIANDEEEIARFRKSLYYYTILDHKRQMGVSEGNIASAFRKICPDSAYYHYEKALGLLAEAGDMRMYWYYKGQLARAYEIGEDYRTAIDIARECLGKDGDERNETLYDLAICYARINI
ncbi:MAG: hypothetical protein J6X81_00420, partial [Muribaculaceae bacterium]|nr:hypothetical protein [Muribaculaceae bacterium]